MHDISKFPLSSAEASLCCWGGGGGGGGGGGEKKKKGAGGGGGGGGGGGERKIERAGFPSSHRPPRAFYFFDYVILMGYPAGASAEERAKFLS